MPGEPVHFGLLLVNQALPDGYKVTGPITNKSLHDHVAGLAKTDPATYVRAITALKRRGDEIATIEGLSVSLDDIAPDRAARDQIIQTAQKELNATTDQKKREQILLQAQGKLLDLTKKRPGAMALMANSGARGNPAQLMKIVASPLIAPHPKKGVHPELIDKSYAEGLTPAQYWNTMGEVRNNEVQARISVSEPGEMAKVLVANTIGTHISGTDCGTKNGVMMSTSDSHILDRYTQANPGVPRNTLVTPQFLHSVAGQKPQLLVRSPMTCSAAHGVCQHCQGLSEKGKLHAIGTAVGVRAAQAMAEPLTQMTLSSRHATLMLKETTDFPRGVKGVRQLLEIPQNFKGEAMVAPVGGKIDRIDVAPQGGHYIMIGPHKIYAAPALKLLHKEGDTIEAGDALTTGVPNPAQVVAHKGIGAGRQYFVNQLHKLYKDEGVNLDRRHLELLAKSEINHVRLLDHDDAHPELLKGDVISYNAFRDAYMADGKEVPVAQGLGQALAKEVLHHTVGTVLTPKLVSELEQAGVRTVHVRKNFPRAEFVMKPFTQNPLLDKDWMGRLAHRYLKPTISNAAAYGEESDIHGTHPVPAFVYGAEMRKDPEGRY